MFSRTISLDFNTEIAVDTQTLFEFHMDTNNLPKITPPWINVKIQFLELPLHQGSTIELDIKRFGLTQRWKMIISQLTSPTLICDEAVQSPFSSFVHHHHFEAIDENTSMLKDELTFSLPFYPLSLIVLPFIKKDMQKMFDYRHKQTKTLLEKKMFNTSSHLNEDCHAQPRPTILLTCGDNIMPLSWHMPVSKSPFRYAISVREENHTHKLLNKNREFALNFLDFSYHHAFHKAGEVHGGNIDKFKLCGLTSKKALSIDTALIEEAYMIYECTLTEVISFGDHDIFIGDVNIILNKPTKPVEPTLFLGKGFYDSLSGEPTRIQRTKHE